jgi:uncharacterized protein YqjF (DUF2071 family)
VGQTSDIPREAFGRIDHRPWQTPERPWMLRQRWLDLLFAHWPARVDDLRPLVPPELKIQEFDGSSWVGLVAFRIEGLSPRGVPDLPGLAAFPELNLRLYVEADNKPGVFFISLDAASLSAVAGARVAFNLPYFHSDMSAELVAGAVRYHSVRRRDRSVRFEADYAPTGSSFEPKPGTVEHFLTERYCLYARRRRGGIKRLDIQHPPWRLSVAEAHIIENTIASRQGVVMDERSRPLLHFAEPQDVVCWLPTQLTTYN